jgi:hypothetical protein
MRTNKQREETKKQYFAPQITRYGLVRDVTNGGGSGMAETEAPTPTGCSLDTPHETC